MTKKVLFITTANLSSNPRLLKEIKLSGALGYQASFVGFYLGGWSDEIDASIVKDIPARGIYLSALREPIWPWIKSSVIHKVCQCIWPLFKRNLLITAYARDKRSHLLHKYLKRINEKYDLLIGHNLGTLYPAWRFSKKTMTPFAFDVEDYHPGEGLREGGTSPECRRREFLMAQLLPKTKYATFASPLIMQKTLELCGKGKIKKPTLINNCFSHSEFTFPPKIPVTNDQMIQRSIDRAINFVWFSQNINHGRGLELVIEALSHYRSKVGLFLIGQVHEAFQQNWISPNKDFITLIDPMPQTDLNRSLSMYDVGLAIELNSADYNRQLCLTNKIWAYLQAGLYILATDTPAQVGFMNTYKNHGLVSKQTIPAIRETIEKIIEDIEIIRKKKVERFEASKQFAWEKESQKIEGVWKHALDDGDITC